MLHKCLTAANRQVGLMPARSHLQLIRCQTALVGTLVSKLEGLASSPAPILDISNSNASGGFDSSGGGTSGKAVGKEARQQVTHVCSCGASCLQLVKCTTPGPIPAPLWTKATATQFETPFTS